MAKSNLALVGEYFQQVDPDLCDSLKADGYTTNVKLGRYVRDCDPAMFDEIVRRVRNGEA